MSITDESILGSVADLEAEIRNEIHKRMTEFAHKIDNEIMSSATVSVKKTSLRDEIERIGKAGHRVSIYYCPEDRPKWEISIDRLTYAVTYAPVEALRNFKT